MPQMIKSQVKLDEPEAKVLQALFRTGAMQPSQVAAETLLLPAELNTALRDLADARLIILRTDDTPDGQVAILTAEGRQAVNQSMSKSGSA